MMKLLLFFFTMVSGAYALPLYAANNIFIYSDDGVYSYCVNETKATLQALLSNSTYIIKTVSKDLILNTDWESTTALFVMPGGKDSLFAKALGSEGNKKIRQYVENGGNYLGICGGSYYAGNSIKFAEGQPSLEIIESRDLSFFPGVVVGPISKDFDYCSEKGCQAAFINWLDAQPFKKNISFPLYYQGGGYFQNAQQLSNVQVLAEYSHLVPPQAGIIECHVQKGRAILSGLHFEFNPHHLDSTNQFLKDIVPQLITHDEHRLKIMQFILKRLGLSNSRIPLRKISSSYSGYIKEIYSIEGSFLKKGDPILKIEAMKMELIIRADECGIVKKILVQSDQEVECNTVLVEFESCSH